MPACSTAISNVPAFDVIAQMVCEPIMDGLAEERQVVLEEIAMYEDDPQDLIFDLFGETVFPGHPLGRAILGHAAVVADATRAQLLEFHHARYVPENIVVAAAGSVEHEQIVGWAAEAFAQPGAPARRAQAPLGAPAPTPGAQRARFRTKETEQFHVCIGGLGLPREDERRFALRVLDSLAGGTSSSRLFQAVRERRGLAYSVFTFQSLYAHSGLAGIYVGTRPENLAEVGGGPRRRGSRACAPLRLTPPSSKARQGQRQGTCGAIAMESTTARMERLGASLLADMPILELDEMLARVDAVSADAVCELAQELFEPERLRAAAIGPDESAFESAATQLIPALERTT